MSIAQRTALAYLTMALSLVACLRTFLVVRAVPDEITPEVTRSVALWFIAALLLGIAGLALLAWSVRMTWRGTFNGREIRFVNTFRREHLFVDDKEVAKHAGFGGRVTLHATVDDAAIVATIGGLLLVKLDVTVNGERVAMTEVV